mmetsp:Transcript_41173/g.130816  ORF Transcript_41173/g.130816 Transcript_41173/m.130816 type:complete len:231 (-) Transcript_41173:200-892(-)
MLAVVHGALPRARHEGPEVGHRLLEHVALPEDLSTATADPILCDVPQDLLPDLRVVAHILSRGEPPIPGIALGATATEAIRVHLHAEDVDDLPQLLVGTFAAQEVDTLQRGGGQRRLAASREDDPVLVRRHPCDFLHRSALSEDQRVQTQASHLAHQLVQRGSQHEAEVIIDAPTSFTCGRGCGPCPELAVTAPPCPLVFTAEGPLTRRRHCGRGLATGSLGRLRRRPVA